MVTPVEVCNVVLTFRFPPAFLIRPADAGHLKVNCPEGAREATLGCPPRGKGLVVIWGCSFWFGAAVIGRWRAGRCPAPTV